MCCVLDFVALCVVFQLGILDIYIIIICIYIDTYIYIYEYDVYLFAVAQIYSIRLFIEGLQYSIYSFPFEWSCMGSN